MKKLLAYLTYFFMPKSHFSDEEWILKYQIQAKLIFSFFFSIGIFFFSIARFLERNYLVSISQFIFSLILLYGFFRLRKDKSFYQVYSISFFIIFLLYTGIIFFNVPQNSLNILWIIFTPILIFFFLNKKAGVIMFLLIFSFIIYLILSDYPYNISEFITLIATFFVTSFMMYMYERMKEAESQRLKAYNITLQKEVLKQTRELARLNVTLEERVQEEIKKQQSQEEMLVGQNRMANMGMMIDTIAHQWRQPLMHINAILMNISHITENDPHNIEYIDHKIDNIFMITQHMSQTIDDFRMLFSPQKEKNSFNVKSLIASILGLLKDTKKDIEIEVKSPENLIFKSYQNELSQVILIILQNAIEAFQEKKIEHKKIIITIEDNQNNIYITINDTAQGIPLKYISRIFEPYFSSKKESLGTGLGLYIAELIVKRSLKGKISAKNIDMGASFQLILPK